MKIDTTVCIGGIALRVVGNYDPGYPPPPCSNPDSPAFSDPGSGPELEDERIYLVDKDANISSLIPDETFETIMEELANQYD